jgi:hypothetical protein
MDMPSDFPQDMRTVVAFKAIGNKTEMTVTEYDWAAGQMFDYLATGLNQSLDKMADSLPRLEARFAV